MTMLSFKKLTFGLLACSVVALSIAFPARISTARAKEPSRHCLTAQRSVLGADTSENLIDEFLSDKELSLDDFHVHGWRWHTMSLVREAGRFHKLALRSKSDSTSALREASDYVIGFNLKGLHKIEATLFFPWMREKLTSIEKSELSSAFATVMDELELDRQKVAELGDSIKRSVAVACDDSNPAPIRNQAIKTVAEESSSLENCARSMMQRENTFLVPAIAYFVPESEQKSFNNKVLLNLGLLDSRLHLVGMHEAVWESDNSKEKELFKQAIPSIPQMMIPRWKRKLYEPKANVLKLEL